MAHALHCLVLGLAGWVTRHQGDLIDDLREENRVLREHLGPRPLRLTDAQRRRLAVRGQTLGRRIVSQGAGCRRTIESHLARPPVCRVRSASSPPWRFAALVHGSRALGAPRSTSWPS